MIEGGENNKVDVYYCTKPIQLLNVLNIPRSSFLVPDLSYLFVLQNYHCTSCESERIKDKYRDRFNLIIFIKKPEELVDAIDFSVNRLFTHSDVGEEKSFIEKVNAKQTFIYEEGSATYFPTYCYSVLQLIKALIRRRSCYMGGSGIIDGVIAYDTALYKKIHGDASISTFEMSFIDALKEYKNNFYDIFEYRGIEPKGVTACVISLSIESHNKYFEKTVTVDFGVYDYVLIKKHPGFTSQTLTEIKNAVYVDTSLPLEFIVLELIEKDFIIDFYHDCSSLLLYMKKYFRTCVNYAPDTVFKSNYEKVNNLLS